MPAADPVSLTWSVRRADDALTVTYEVRNLTDATVWLLDQQLTFAAAGGVEPSPRAVVRAADGGPVRIVRGWLPPQAFPMREVRPGARPLEPGKTVAGTAILPLPLTTWHPNEPDAARVYATTAVLEVGVLRERPEDEGPHDEVTRADASDQILVRGEPLPL